MIGLLSIGNCLHIQFHLVFLSMNFGQSIFVFLDPRILKSFWHKLTYIFEKNLDAEITRKSRKLVWWIKRSWKCLRNVSNYCTINKNMTEAAYQNWIATYWIHSQRSTGFANPRNEKSPRFVLTLTWNATSMHIYTSKPPIKYGIYVIFL